ncbi:MAG: MOSC N-terminal beta barrel domain-containing protein [Methylobacter sp.]
MKIDEIWRYPVKTMAGEKLQRACIGPLGIAGDRVVHVEDVDGQVITSRTHPRFLGHKGTLGPDGGSRRTIAYFRGKEKECNTAREAYIWLIERFAKINPTLFTNLKWETTGYVAVGRRKGPKGVARMYFAKSPDKLFKESLELVDKPKNFHRLTNGWYANLNLNTRENFEILCRFAAVSNLKHLDDWDWKVFDPTEQLQDARDRTILANKIYKEMDELL